MSRRTLISLLALGIVCGSPGAVATAGVGGQVIDPAGKGIGGLRVRAVPAGQQHRCSNPTVGSDDNLAIAAGVAWGLRDAATVIEAVTDDEGRFTIAGEEGVPHVLVAGGPARAPLVAGVDPGTSAEMRLVPGRRLTLEILGRDDLPLAGGQVTVVPLDVCGEALAAFENLLVRRGVSDDSGRLEIPGIADGTYAVELRATEHATTVAGPLVVAEGRTGYRLRLPAGRGLRGSVRRVEGRTVAPDHVVAIWNQDGFDVWSRSPVDADGNWQLEGLPVRGSVRVVAAGQAEFGPARQLRSEQQGPELVGPLDPPGAAGWWGQIDAAGDVGRLIIVPERPRLPALRRDELAAVETLVDERGLFLLPNLPADVTSLSVIALGYGAAQLALAGKTPRDLGLVVLESLATTENRLTWASGAPAGGLPLVVLHGQGPECRTRTTVDGSFACAWPAPPGDGREYLSISGLATVRFETRDDGTVAVPSPVTRVRAVAGSEGEPVEYLALKEGDGDRALRFARAVGGQLELRGERLADSALVAGHADEPAATVSSIEASGRLLFELASRATIRGEVVAEEDGSPLPDARVELRPLLSQRRGAPISRVAYADGSGAWSFPEVSAGAHRLSAGHPGYRPVNLEIEVTEDENHRLALGHPGSIRGSVLGMELDERASVRLWPRGSESRGTVAVVEDGRFTFDNVDAGNYLLILSVTSGEGNLAGASISRELEVLPGQVHHVDLNAGRGILLAGSVMLSDRPLPGGSLSFLSLSGDGLGTNARAVIDPESHYAVSLDQPGIYEVALYDRERSLLGHSRIEIEVSDDPDQEQGLRFSDGKIRGRVVDTEGQPVSGTRITLFSRPGERSAKPPGPVDGWNFLSFDENDADGSFDFAGLSGGEYFMALDPRGYVPVEEGPVELEADGEIILPDVVVRRGQSLRLQVSGPAGQPIEGARIFGIAGEWRESLATPSTESRSDGSATLKGLAPGTYSILGSVNGHAPVIHDGVEVAAEVEPELLELRFSRGSRLEVQVLDSEGAAVSGARITLVDRAGRDMGFLYSLVFGRQTTDADGRIVLPAVHPGTFNVGVAEPMKGTAVEVSLAAGENRTVVVYTD